MRPLLLGEMVAIDAYERLRDAYRARVMALKRERRLAVGDRVTLVFENRETLRFQVQEMMRVERLRDPEKVQHELDVYNELVPGAGELSATLLIEITEAASIRAELDRLLGIDACVFLVLGEGAQAARVRARFDEKQLDEDRISAVHYLRFEVGAGAAGRLREPAVAAHLAIEHAHYHHVAALPPALRASLAADLEGDPLPLLEAPSDGGIAETAPGAVLFERGHVRVRRPERASGRGHVVVEPTLPVASLLDADPALLAELLAAAREQARAIFERHGACRVQADLSAPRLRWDVFAPEG